MSSANQCTMSGARVGISGAERARRSLNCAYCGKALKIRVNGYSSDATVPNHNKPKAKP